MDQVPELSLLGGEGVELVDVELAELFDVDRTTISVLSVVELGVISCHFALFGVVEAVSVSERFKGERSRRASEIKDGVGTKRKRRADR